MSTHVTDLVGYKHDPARKSWLGAFFIGAFDDASEKPEGHYELLPLSEISTRAAAAVKAGERDAALEYTTAQTAIQETIEGKRATPHDLPTDFQDKLYEFHNNKLFKVINPVADVDWTEFKVAQKTAQVKAEFVAPGTKVETIMSNGLVETSKTAGADGGYKVTAQTGEQYLVDKTKFEKIYTATGTPEVYAPVSEPRKVLGLDRNVSFTAPWGEPMRIQSGGVLVNSGKKDVYGIQPDEFRASYTFR
jgi:hypothetical protein